MKAAVLERPGSKLRIVSGVQVPAPGRGQVLVHLAYSGVCHSQLMEASGARGPDPYLPHLLGHEGSGVVLEVGPEVTKVKRGDRVILGWIKGRGADVPGPRYTCGCESFNAGGVTTFNERAVVSENRCVLLPEGVPMDVAVLFGCALPTGAGILINEIRPEPRKTIAIYGLGGIGLSALMAAKLFEFRQIIGVDVSDAKLALANEFGATSTINSLRQDPVAEIRALTGGQGVDYSVDASGSASVTELAFASIRRGGGLCVFASHPSAGSQIRLDPYELICGKQIRGSWGGACDPDIDIPRLAQLYVSGKLPLRKLLSRRYALDQINEALEDLDQQRVERPLIELDPTLERAA